jgi:hypothetical protein
MSTTLDLLYLAKQLKTILNYSFIFAKDEFVKIYSSYIPSGIGDYVDQNWNKIM